VTSQTVTIVVTIGVLALFMILIERRFPGRNFPKVDRWAMRALSINLWQVLAIWLAGIGWNAWMLKHRAWSTNNLGTLGGALAGYLVLTFVYYWWHVWRHRSDFLWRWFHQIHHNPQRLELLTAFYKHPLELVSDSLLSSAVLYLGFGLSPAAAAGAMVISGMAELFYHWNIKTPYWLGFVIQRPESHLIHHQEMLHDYNYSALPIWDFFFGTFKNPRQWNGRCGFGPCQEHPVLKMLRGLDVSKPPQRRAATSAFYVVYHREMPNVDRKHKPSRTLARRELNEIGSIRRVVVSIGTPRRHPKGDWEGWFSIEGLGKRDVQRVGGVDALQALLISVQGARDPRHDRKEILLSRQRPRRSRIRNSEIYTNASWTTGGSAHQRGGRA